MFQLRGKMFALWLLLTQLTLPIGVAFANTYDLDSLLNEATQEHPIVKVSQAHQAAAQAGMTMAKSYFNPEVEIMGGPINNRTSPSTTSGNVTLGIAQTLEWSSIRSARSAYAEEVIGISQFGLKANVFELRNQIKQAYIEVIKREQLTDLQQTNFDLLKQIHGKVKVKVDTGEVPKYELIKADTELLSAERDLQTAQAQVLEAKALVRRLIGPRFPEQFALSKTLPSVNNLPQLNDLKRQALDSPYLQKLGAEKASAQAKMTLEEKLRTPSLTLKSYYEQNPDQNIVRFGFSLPLPLWNLREGQIAEAYAGLQQAESQLQLQTLSLNGELDAAYQRYLMAKKQVDVYESGLLSQSSAVLQRAEAAYKYGERGILEYLDAQRVNKAVNRDYLLAKFEYLSNLLQIERLVGVEIVLAKPVASQTNTNQPHTSQPHTSQLGSPS